MRCRDWIITGTVAAFVVVQIAHVYMHPLDWKKYHQPHVELHKTFNITPAPPTDTKEAQERVGIGLSERADIEKIEK